MATALNLTLPLRPDQETQARLWDLQARFGDTFQPFLKRVLDATELVHFARVVSIGDRYLQVLFEYDGEVTTYIELFRRALAPLFQQLFSLVEGVPPWDDLDAPDKFHQYFKALDAPSLGRAEAPSDTSGYLFSAYGDATVRDIRARLHATGSRGASNELSDIGQLRALNLTLPVGTDPQTRGRLDDFRVGFADSIQPSLDAHLRASEMVHFARIVSIGDRYLQLLAIHDSSERSYSHVFQDTLKPILKTLMSFVDGAPPWEDLADPWLFQEYLHTFNLSSLGSGRGYMYSAYGDISVKEIRRLLDPDL